MCQRGDIVELVRALQGYLPGAEGIVLIKHRDGNLTAAIYLDHNNKPVIPPDPLKPAKKSNFKKKHPK